MKEEIRIESIDYHLPKDLVAQHPLDQRDQSRLLVYKGGRISHDHFFNIQTHLPKDHLLVFNNTRVIPARVHFFRKTGARIELFLLEPVSPFADMERALEISEGPVQWECMIGNLKKWKDGEVLELLLDNKSYSLKARLLDRSTRRVQFDWDSDRHFSEVINDLGKIPLPPYINRESEASDSETYQTVYSKIEGAVAAPTAGLHFSQKILEELKSAGVEMAELTLHVGAGTFQPLTSEVVNEHKMHKESFILSQSLLDNLLSNSKRVAVGTTSLRALESIYWIGVKIQQKLENPFEIEQNVYERLSSNLSYEKSLELVRNFMIDKDLMSVLASTAIMIKRNYKIKSIEALITNFHLPKSTLLLLVESWIGPNWKKMYAEAVDNNYRFLSYGDSSILFP